MERLISLASFPQALVNFLRDLPVMVYLGGDVICIMQVFPRGAGAGFGRRGRDGRDTHSIPCNHVGGVLRLRSSHMYGDGDAV